MYCDETIEWKGELWSKKWLEEELTGHLYRNSPIETSSDCGNCDGANCDICERIWIVGEASIPSDLTKSRPDFSWVKFTDKKAAEEYFDEI